MKSNELVAAREINNQLDRLYTTIISEPFPAIVKMGLEIMGLPAGKPRKPLANASEEMRSLLKNVLTEIGLI